MPPNLTPDPETGALVRYDEQSFVDRVRKALRGRPSPVALLTDNLIARTAIAAMRLFNPKMRAFPTGALKEAGEFLTLTVAERERVAALLVELEREVGESNVVEPPAGSGAR